MKTNIINLSRRKVLASLSGIGLASAGAGLGTTAYFSDEERFDNNSLTAGQLDLKVDWREWYFDGSDGNGLGDYIDGSVPTDAVGFPSNNPIFSVSDGNLDQFLDEIALEAYPDVNGDGTQTPPIGWDDPESDSYVCSVGADVDEDLDPRDPSEGGSGTGLRTNNNDTWDDDAGESKPLVSLEDVKPCDFGFISLSFHLCDNPGYVWLSGDLIENDQNGTTEPEAERLDELYGEVPTEGQLADALRARVWRFASKDPMDPGNELLFEGSVADVLSFLDSGHGIRLSPTGTSLDPVAGDGETLEEEDCEFVEGNPSCDGRGEFDAIKIEADDSPQLPPATVGASQTYSTAFGNITITVEEVKSSDDGDEITLISFESDFEVNTVIVKGGPNAQVCQKTDDGDVIPVTTGTDLGAPFKDGNDRFAISHVSFCVEEEPDGERGCFEPSTTHYIGLEWWLPCEVGNEVQTDSISFDLGFYSEQCRHNDGFGIV